MENNFEHILISAGQKNLFGNEISQEEVIEIISKYPTTLWLDLFSKIESFLIIPREEFFKPHVFLVENLFCPSALERTKRKANIGNVYFSLGQLNLLRKLAIIHGNESNQTEIEKIDITKVLLGAQDIHNGYDEINSAPDDFENFCKFVLRSGYLNSNTDSSTLFFRAKKIYLDQSDRLPLYPNIPFSDFFQQTVGMTPLEAICLNFALVNPFFLAKETLWGQTAILPTNYFGQTTIDPKMISLTIDSIAVDFDVVKQDLINEVGGKDLKVLPVGYDLSIFRKTPIIRLSDGRLICANLSCLLQKATHNIIWMATKGVTGNAKKALINDLTQYRGELFEEYLKEICSEMCTKNANISFIHIPPEETEDHEEIGDSILTQGNKIVIFEAKSRQFLESFKTTGDWANDPTFIEEFIKASQQIETAANKIISGAISIAGVDSSLIEKIYPVIVTYESVPMHGKMQRFIRQKVQEAGFLTGNVFAPLEIIIIDDLEHSIDAVETVSLIDILNEKNSGNDPHASESNLHNFFTQYLSQNRVLSTGWQRQQVDRVYDEVFLPFFKDKFK